MKSQILSQPDEGNQREWDAKVSQCDQGVRKHVQEEQLGVPQVAMAVGHEAIAGKELCDEVHNIQ